MATQTGPRLRVESSCIGCDRLIPGGERPPQCLAMAGRMMPTTSPTPAWCPELPAARLALARSVVAEAPCQVSLVRQTGGNLPCVRKGEHAEHQSACGRRWGGEDFTDHPDFDSRAFCDDGSEAP